jgi:hypothetical protein
MMYDAEGSALLLTAAAFASAGTALAPNPRFCSSAGLSMSIGVGTLAPRRWELD